jgi:hypothetical protein
MTHSDRDPVRFRLQNGHLMGVFLVAGAFIYLSSYPLGHTDVWAHAKYGEWYWTHQKTPGVEPLSPYTDKTLRFPDVAWLSQVTYYLLYQFGATAAGGDAESQLQGGAEALRSFHLFMLVGRIILLWLALRRFGGSCMWATLGVFLYFMAVGIGSAVQRPQAFGLFFFTVVLYALSSPRLSRRALVLLPIAFVLWANLHGTFVVGLLVLGLHTVGRAIERGMSDPEVRRLALVSALCGLATLVNPNGPFLYQQVLSFSGHPNLKTMTEWYPMRVTAASGAHWPYLMSLLLLAFVRVLGGRTVGAAGWLVALPFALWPWLQARMLLWWWGLAVWLLARLGPGLADRFPTLPALPDGPPSRAKAWMGVAVVVIAVLFVPPLRALVIPRALGDTVSPGTPWRMALELKANPTDHGRWFPSFRTALAEHYPDGRFRGAIFSTETQGDFLIWALPAEWPVLMFTHAHVFPVDHWEACRHVKAGNPGWREFLARHGTNLIVAEADTHEELAAELRNDPEWIVVHDGPPDGGPASRMIVAVRKKPL